MKLNKNKIDVIRAEKQISTEKLVKGYGASRARIYAILNSQNVTPECAGKLAKALDCDVADITEQ